MPNLRTGTSGCLHCARLATRWRSPCAALLFDVRRRLSVDTRTTAAQTRVSDNSRKPAPRLPLVIRQFRVRQGDRPAFRVNDERDLEDLLRSILPLHFDDIRPECRTPSYAAGTRTDFLLSPESIALTIKQAQPRVLSKCPKMSHITGASESTTLSSCLSTTRNPRCTTYACRRQGAELGEGPEVRCVVSSL